MIDFIRRVSQEVRERMLLSSRLKQGSYTDEKHRKRCRRRAGIAALISHLKNYYKLGTNYLKRKIGKVFNSLLVAVGLNLHLLMSKFSREVYLLSTTS